MTKLKLIGSMLILVGLAIAADQVQPQLDKASKDALLSSYKSVLLSQQSYLNSINAYNNLVRQTITNNKWPEGTTLIPDINTDSVAVTVPAPKPEVQPKESK